MEKFVWNLLIFSCGGKKQFKMNLHVFGYCSENKAEFNHFLVQLLSETDIGVVGPPDKHEGRLEGIHLEQQQWLKWFG